MKIGREILSFVYFVLGIIDFSGSIAISLFRKYDTVLKSGCFYKLELNKLDIKMINGSNYWSYLF